MKEKGRKKEQQNQINVGAFLEKPKKKFKLFNIIQNVSLTILKAFYTETVRHATELQNTVQALAP